MTVADVQGLSGLARLASQAADAHAWRSRAALHVLDWLANTARGLHTPTGVAFERWLCLQPDGPVPTLAGRRVDAASAACFHGALGSPLEMDDVHRSSILHPGPVVIPAALAALASRDEATGPQLLSALLAGYEVAIRVGRALGPAHYRLWHSTSTAGHFAAAAAAGTAMGLDEERLAHAMALAGTKAGGLWQVRHESQAGKFWHMAGAARDGLSCAQLAACGLTGPLAVLEGPSGWMVATAGAMHGEMHGELTSAQRLATLLAPRATPWLDDVSFKPWPACRHAHPAMDALRTALDGVVLDANEVRRIEVRVYADAQRFCDRAAPTNSAQAKFSIQHALAAWLVWGEPRLEHYEAEAIGDSRVADLRLRVQLLVDASFEARYPAQYGAAINVHTHDGRLLTAELPDTYGDPARPMGVEAVQAKARMLLTSAGWAESRIQAALQACADLPEAQNLQALHAVMCP